MRSKHLNKVIKFARILNLRFLDYLPCTSKIPGQRSFLGIEFLSMNRFSFFFVTLFTTFGIQKDDDIIFV